MYIGIGYALASFSGIPRIMVRIFVDLYIIDHAGRGATVRVYMDFLLKNVLLVLV